MTMAMQYTNDDNNDARWLNDNYENDEMMSYPLSRLADVIIIIIMINAIIIIIIRIIIAITIIKNNKNHNKSCKIYKHNNTNTYSNTFYSDMDTNTYTTIDTNNNASHEVTIVG